MTTKHERDEAIDTLRARLTPGQTLYTYCDHVSRSGMYRSIHVVRIHKDEPDDMSWLVGRILWGVDPRHGGVKASGSGMDMGFHTVYSLGSILFPAYTCLGQGCPSNYHNNPGEPSTTAHTLHRDGYALKQRWL